MSKLKKAPKIAIIGAGIMGEGILAALLRSGVYSPQDIRAYEILEERREYITRTYQVECLIDIKKVLESADICLIAVKPGDVPKVMEEISPFMDSQKLLISIAAGVPLDFYRKHLPKNVPVMRVMPNIAVQVRESMITFCVSDNINEEKLKGATEMLSLLGRVMRLDEKYLNLATGLVGSGPAYIYLIIDALADAGVRTGLPKDISIFLAAQTTLGSAKMVIETGKHPAELKDKVVTPAGTTIEGLLELERAGLKAVIMTAVTKATERARELAPQNQS